MLLDNPSSDPALGQLALSLLAGLQLEGAQDAIDAQLSGLDMGPVGSVFSPGNASFPRWYWGGNSEHSVFIAQGVQNTQQAILLLEGYERSDPSFPGFQCNRYLVQQADAIHGLPAVVPMRNSANVLFIGHSAGGALAVAMLGAAKIQDLPQTRKCITFGGPRSGDFRIVQLCAGDDVTRWMNNDDPVPILPPTVQQVPALAVLYPYRQWIVWGHQRHVQGGMQLSANGSTVARELPEDAEIGPTLSLQQWLVNQVQEVQGPHSIGTYTARMLLVARAAIPGPERQRRRADAEPEPDINVNDLRKEIREIVRTLFTRGTAQQGGPLILPPDKIFRNVRIFGVWYCFFGNTCISIGPDRRRSGRLAQFGNKFIAKLQRQGAVDGNALVRAWFEYIAAASDPASGIRPTLSIGRV